MVALLGANGAGKSTTLKAISGLLKHEDGEVTDGSIEFMGQRIDRRDAEEISKLGIIQVIEGRRVFEHLSVEENLRVGAHLRKESSTVRDGLEGLPFSRLNWQQTAGLSAVRTADAGHGRP
jgi:branched-chain amino acid transport system ATP-binding protein